MSLAIASQEKPRVKRKREGGDEKSDAEGRHAGDLVEDAQHDNLAGAWYNPRKVTNQRWVWQAGQEAQEEAHCSRGHR